MNQNGLNGFMSQLNQLKQTFNGDPNQKIQELLNTGKVSQAQYDKAVQMANQIQSMMKI
jgi:hypothetical protein